MEIIAAELLMRFTKDLNEIAQKYNVYAEISFRVDTPDCYFLLMESEGWVRNNCSGGGGKFATRVFAKNLNGEEYYKAYLTMLDQTASQLVNRYR